MILHFLILRQKRIRLNAIKMIYIKQKVSGQKTSTLVSTFYKSLVLFQYNFHKNKICETLNWHIIKI